ncbi:MAG: nqo5 [Gammaproteobacteria bacterium]|jgi:NADH-quinone oxidoreductase subunit C|nr:nqo5 [Gammaproteobacteria bacterium]
MSTVQLSEDVYRELKDKIAKSVIALDELTITVRAEDLREVCLALKNPPFDFDTLIDICGVDYLHYGISEWHTTSATTKGFSRAVSDRIIKSNIWDGPRFAVVYHFLSVTQNHRIRIRVFCEVDDAPQVDSVTDIWPAANWFEREAFDLFGIVFNGHPDLRRILTDYGFIGHPFRKNFPLIGEVEMRYDAAQRRCIYEPVSIQPRTLVPKVIREKNVHAHPLSEGEKSGE